MPNHQSRVYDSMLEMLSGEENPTPLVRLHQTVPFEQTQVFGKLEWYNPFGAVKDRIAANMLQRAEEAGELVAGNKLVEPTSGNTGFALTLLANLKGYTVTSPLSTEIPLEKRALLRFFGNDVIELQDTLCPAPGAPEGAIALAHATAEQPDFHMLNQYANTNNPQAHYQTTGPEIWKQTEQKVTHLVAGLGTCGTLTGAGRFLREKNPDITLVGVHPEEGHDIPGVRSIRQLEQTELFDRELMNHLVEVTNREAFDMCLRLNREESIIAGPSSGMALAGALKVIEDQPDSVVVVIFPDNVFKYASSVQRHFAPLFRNTVGSPANPNSKNVQEERLNRMIELARNQQTTIDLDAAAALDNTKTLFVDVREPQQYQASHVAGAVHIPIDALLDGNGALPTDLKQPIITVCNLGNLSLSGMLILKSRGYEDVRSMNGGTLGWIDKGYPVETM
ncbi:MAG: pyridoxal-phosphate dependent enzyme [Planctomycetes bacterium]|nr:pyridoxal-phosphate dependent enzyme [Planctomycetota bacterium]